MSRRPHRKSRNGCLQCKKRHIRCDGYAPICANCRSAEIRCSYMDKEISTIVPAVSNGFKNGNTSSYTSSPTLDYASPAASTSSSGSRQSGQTDTDTAPPFSMPVPVQTNTQNNVTDPYDINSTHLELFCNLSGPDFTSGELAAHRDNIPASVYIQHGLSTPYLIHQMLAMSALHMSTKNTDPSRISHYRSYATGLQNRALALFNEANPILTVTQQNCVQMFLFSSAVAVHLLSEILHYQRDSLESFIERIAHDISVYRGVTAVASQCTPLLRETQVAPGMTLDQALLKLPDATGSDCSPLPTLIENSPHLSSSSREIYNAAILELQRIFDAGKDAKSSRVAVIFTWLVTVSEDYVGLLRQGEAEALVILAYYAVLLHRARDMWLIGNGGRWLIEGICSKLGEKWNEWLVVPRRVLLE